MAVSGSDATYCSCCKEEKGRFKKSPLLLVWISGFGGNTDALKNIYIFY